MRAPLVEAGADPSLADGERVTPFAHARRKGYDEIAAILQRSGGRAYQTCPDPYSTAQRSR